MTGAFDLSSIGRSARDFTNASLRSAMASNCFWPNSHSVPFQVSLTRWCAWWTKFLMKSRQTPMVPRKACTSVRSLQGPQLVTFSTQLWLGSRPLDVHRCPSTVISGAQSWVLNPEKVPLQYFILCTIQFKSPKCSQMNCQIPGLSRIASSSLFDRMYLMAGPQTGTSLIYGWVTWGISGGRMLVTLSWNIGTEFVHPIGNVVTR